MRTPPLSFHQAAARILAALVVLLLIAPLHAEQFGDFTYEISPDDTITITDYPDDAVGEVVIPTEIHGKPVTRIGWRAFSGCTSLASITLPDSVTSIGDDAFAGCSSLTAIEVGPGNPRYSSDHGVLLDFVNKTLVRCPEGKSGRYEVPEGVTAIKGKWYLYRDRWCGTGGFENCRLLTEVTFPEGFVEIGPFGFAGCAGLTRVTFPDSVTRIEGGAFLGCTGLASVTIPASVTRIGTYVESRFGSAGAFESCTGLTSVILEQGLTIIGDMTLLRNLRLRLLSREPMSLRCNSTTAMPAATTWASISNSTSRPVMNRLMPFPSQTPPPFCPGVLMVTNGVL